MGTIWCIVVVLKIQLMNSDLVVSVFLFGLPSHFENLYLFRISRDVNEKRYFLFNFVFIYFMWMSVSPAHVSVHHVSQVPLKGQKRVVASPGAQVTESYELPSGCWEANLGPLQGYQLSRPQMLLFIAWITQDLYVENATQSCWYLIPINNFMTWLIFAISILEMILQRNGWRWNLNYKLVTKCPLPLYSLNCGLQASLDVTNIGWNTHEYPWI